MFQKILIANRGEIAVRIMKTCQALGIRTVAVYSEADAQARHRLMADEAILLGPANPTASYLDANKVIAAAKQTYCEAIHPGYGFLSENADFAAEVQAAGLTFIGPNPAAIGLMGNKTAARRWMQQAGIPVVPGFADPKAQIADFLQAAQQIGYPVLVKAAAGGGGKGMRTVWTPDELADALAAARREAKNAFGNDHVYLEKYLLNPRHIEVQILADGHGNCLHLFERECSIQRRHQKIVEETPSPYVNETLRQRLTTAALTAARAVDYVNAGTVEFLVSETGDFYFLEMNTRLQVEHPITEGVTGIDLVQAQLMIANGDKLPFTQADLQQHGHAIECRIYAEDPSNQFLPVVGTILEVIEPTGGGVRVDSGIQVGDEITVHYDPLLAKLIVHAADRVAAISKLDWALQQFVILGVTTNISFLWAILQQAAFQTGQTNTHFIADHLAHWATNRLLHQRTALIAAALFDELSIAFSPTGTLPLERDQTKIDPWQISDGFRIGKLY